MRGANRFMFQKMCKYVESIEWYVMSVCALYFVDGRKLAVFKCVQKVPDVWPPTFRQRRLVLPHPTDVAVPRRFVQKDV